jgi:plasmid stabilization system protein ParE
MGRLWSELAKDFRSFANKRHVICYLKMVDGIGILRMLHGSMDIDHSGLF